ncbi:glycosyltransferase [Streptomyces roseicoloratus]|uniref:glycosyltransferase n=1 Tax=Streptomyces roseicoloratus TaxID=2508722 RepID=UPI001009E19D|nr:glycosyltransferase [Streptomyces roseicoloratus]
MRPETDRITSVGPEIHLFEPSGYAGVFQHTCRLGELLARTGRHVVLHTGHEHEEVRLEGVELCPCSWWPRDRPAGARRSAAIAGRFVGRTLPHLHRRVPRGAVLHVEGIAAAGALTLAVLGVARIGHRRVVYSPHDTFSRRGRVDGALLRIALRVPHAIVVYSRADVEVLRRRGLRAHCSPLVQLVPRPTEEERRKWRSAWRADADTSVVLFAGCIRPEKRLDVLIESARDWPADRRLAVVGEDRGGWARCAELARAYGVDVAARVEFLGLDEFAAAISAADLVVLPYDKASQSGVLAVARRLGTPTAAANVGGLRELASQTFAAGDPHDLNRAIDTQLAEGRAPDPASDDHRAVDVHLLAYRRPA